MADGMRTIKPADAVEVAARKIARALGHGYGWIGHVEQVNIGDLGEKVTAGADAYAIVRRGAVVEQAAKSIQGGARVRRQHRWSVSHAMVAIPQHRPDMGVLAALSYAKLSGPLEPLLYLYATGDAHYWAQAEPYAVACIKHPHGATAMRDAVQRILYGRAEISQDGRAKLLGIRAATYRAITKRCEAMLWRWLNRAAYQFLNSLNGTGMRPPNA